MSKRVVELTHSFYEWERRGRGWDLNPETVSLEPPLSFPDWHRAPRARVDDARRETWLSSLFSKSPPAPAVADPAEELDDEIAADPFVWSEALSEVSVLLPDDLRFPTGTWTAWLAGLSTAHAPISFELLGQANRVELRFATGERDASLLQTSLRSVAPTVVVQPAAETLRARWDAAPSGYVSFLELGLGREFMVPLPETGSAIDSLAQVVAGLGTAGADDIGVVQVLFAPVSYPWADAIRLAVMTPSGKRFFQDAPEITQAAMEKTRSRLFSCVVRIACRSEKRGRAFEMLRQIAAGFGRLGAGVGNELIPLAVEDVDELEEDILARTTHRTGMILSARELAELVHLPGDDVALPELARATAGVVAPASVTAVRGVYLGENDAGGQRNESGWQRRTGCGTCM